MPASIILTDAEERYAPPKSPVLLVNVVGDRVFLEIAEADETVRHATYTKLASIAVHAAPLLQALSLAHVHHEFDLSEAAQRRVEDAEFDAREARREVEIPLHKCGPECVDDPF